MKDLGRRPILTDGLSQIHHVESLELCIDDCPDVAVAGRILDHQSGFIEAPAAAQIGSDAATMSAVRALPGP